MNYDNYLSGGGSPYSNALASGRTQPQPAVSQPMSMEEFSRYLAMLSPEQQAELIGKVQGINWDPDGKGGGGGNPLQKLMGMFGKSRTAEGG